ncbi:hypothetical protein [Nostoc sp.]|uniref:hypothetical protein n=1 Tax=Nostoc sp. TaxID=1180 RepID=UPI002FFCD080
MYWRVYLSTSDADHGLPFPTLHRNGGGGLPGVRNLSRKYILPHPIRVRLHPRLCLPHQLPLLQRRYHRAIAPLVLTSWLIPAH